MISVTEQKVIEDFGKEWSLFDQSKILEKLESDFEAYFSLFPWDQINADSIGFDMGCGSGRWAWFVADRVKHLYCVDPSSQALSTARKNLSSKKNVTFKQAACQNIPLENNSMDFGYCLGVLHHLQDPLSGLKVSVKKLKPGSPFLIYCYYAFDNRPLWFRYLWKVSDVVRRLISKLPFKYKVSITGLIALFIYLPCARFSKFLDKLGCKVENFPLYAYRDKDFYTMKTDSLDRFSTRIEKRFSRNELRLMMQAAGLENISFSDALPYWCALGYKKLS